ncbi:hypothetical protein ACM9XA_11375 [Xanthomonas sacchari]
MPPKSSSSNTIPPLVRVERINGVVFAIFTDPARPGFEYDPSIRSARQALEIARHVASKSWITEAHLEQFKALMLAEFGESAAHG